MTSDLQDQILTKIAKKMQAEIDEQFMSQWIYKPNFFIHDESVVDGATWYIVGCYDDTSQWLRSQDQKLWHEHINNKFLVINHLFDIHEKLYTMLALKWS
jgi:hypothetical protein